MKENEYQSKLIKKLRRMFPGCIILKNDPNYLQGILDLTIFVGSKWAMLEVKTSADAPFRPNQEYYIKKTSEMSFGAVIYPENEKEVLREIQIALSD